MHHHNKSHSHLVQSTSSVGLATSAQAEELFAPPPDEIARKAYFAYVNEGSLPGHEVQHWLGAESELIAERDRTRQHGYHNRT